MEIKNFFPNHKLLIKFVREEGCPDGGVEHNGYMFPGFVIAPQFVTDFVTKRIADEYKRPIKNVTCTFRHGVDSRILVHTDIAMGTHTAVVYLSPNIGTAFWRDKMTGEEGVSSEQQDAQNAVDELGNDLTRWEKIRVSEGEVNECKVYDSTKYHSIFPYKDLDSRLVCVTFFTLG